MKIWDPNYWYDGRLLHFKRNCQRSDAWIKFSFTVLEDSSGVYGELPAQHPKRPKRLASPEETARLARKGFPVEPPEGFKVKLSNTKHSRKRKASRASNRRTRKVFRASSDDDADMDVRFAASAAVGEVTGSDISFPKFIDPFTSFEIKKPAISPYCHVCEYDTWTKVLRTPGLADNCSRGSM